jgi:hypothetical protein
MSAYWSKADLMWKRGHFRVWPQADVDGVTMLEMIDEPVRVTHDCGFPPFAEVKDGKSEGLAVDIFRTAAAQAGINVKIVPVSFEQRQLTLAFGRWAR